MHLKHPVQLPPPVRPGARVGVAALSGAVDPERLERGIEELHRLGFRPVRAANLERRHHLFAGTDDERLAAFHELAADPEVEAIVFARGGSGVLRILDRIDWRLLASRPRAYVGYSDLTPFLLEVVRRLGIAAFHGPMVAADLERGLLDEERRALLAALAGELPLRFPVGGWLRRGAAVGPVLGGCLTMLGAIAGTPFLPALDGALLVVEDVDEQLYRLDRLLTQLRLAGRLDRLAGLVLGHVDLASGEDPATWREIVGEQVAGFAWPVATDLAVGHSPPNLTLPLGLAGRLDPSGALEVGIQSPLS